jgi:hypothetical protein
MKIVINTCFGGFSLSQEAMNRYRKEKGATGRISRDDEVLVKIVEELGTKANGFYSELKIVEIPDDVKWCIEDFDGKEWVAEEHRTWE